MISKIRPMVTHQLHQNFTLSENEEQELLSIIPTAARKCMLSFQSNRNKYYQNIQIINPLHADQYAQFLYFLSKEASHLKITDLADKIYYLNRMLNGCDLYHAINLPTIFTIDHPLGSVMGRANYGNYFSFQQGCTIGNNKGHYPTLGENVRLFANSTVIGDSKIGNHVFISANCYVKDEDIPSCSIIFGSSPNLVIKKKPLPYFLENSLFHIVPTPLA